MKRLMLLLCAALLLTAALPCARAESDAPLRFAEDGTFTVMLLSDMQDTQYPSAYLARSVDAVLNQYHVDLVVLLGDQLEGGSPLLHTGDGRRNVERALMQALSPLKRAGVPFTFVYGNHDYEAPLSVEQQSKIYRAYENCVTPVCDESGAYRLPVYATDGSLCLNLYFFESGPSNADGSYGAVSAEQVAWYRATAENLYAENGGQTVPAVAFQHVIMREVYALFTEAPADADGAFLFDDGRRYLPNSADMLLGETLEAPCPSLENNGLFEAFLERGDVFLAMAGHDHVNSFIGRVSDVDLGTAPGSSFTSYGSDDARGVRLLRFNEYDVKSYDTIHVRYADFINARGLAAIPYYFSTTTRIPNLAKAAFLLLVLLALAVVVVLRMLRARKHPAPAPDPEADTGYDDPSKE